MWDVLRNNNTASACPQSSFHAVLEPLLGLHALRIIHFRLRQLGAAHPSAVLAVALHRCGSARPRSERGGFDAIFIKVSSARGGIAPSVWWGMQGCEQSDDAAKAGAAGRSRVQAPRPLCACLAIAGVGSLWRRRWQKGQTGRGEDCAAANSRQMGGRERYRSGWAFRLLQL